MFIRWLAVSPPCAPTRSSPASRCARPALEQGRRRMWMPQRAHVARSHRHIVRSHRRSARSTTAATGSRPPPCRLPRTAPGAGARGSSLRDPATARCPLGTPRDTAAFASASSGEKGESSLLRWSCALAKLPAVTLPTHAPASFAFHFPCLSRRSSGGSMH